MKLKIGEKEYTLEYTFEAVASEDCIKKTIDLFETLDNEELEIGNRMATLPNTVITLFHCGLLENHSELDREDARKLLKQYFKENKDNEDVEDATFYGMMLKIFEQMGEDGFFKQIGLAESPKKEPKTPQDRKRKTTKTQA